MHDGTKPHDSKRLIFWAISLILVSFNLRTIFPSFGALMPEIREALHLSSTLVSIITTLPVLCLGLFAPFAPKLAQDLTIERTIYIALLLLASGIYIRGLNGLTGLVIGTIIAGASIAIINVLLPSLIKRDFSKFTGLMSGLYAMALLGGTAVSAGMTIPLQHFFQGSWSKALSCWSIPAILTCIIWYKQFPKNTVRSKILTPKIRGLLHCKLAWQVTIFMVLQSMYSFSVFGWLAPFLRDRGIAAIDASLIVSISIFLQTIACFLAPMIATRLPHQSWFNIVVVLLTLVGFLGCLAAPISSIIIWAVILGLGQGALTSIAMTMIVLRSESTFVAAKLSSMVQSIGFGIGAFGSLFIGLIYRSPNHFIQVEIFLVCIAILLLYFGFKAGQQRYVSTYTD
jgi:CP family cyanate transporter-like MFS transporter